jgi:hypothetical protein
MTAASVGNRAPAVLRRREQTRFIVCERRRSTAETMRAMREQLGIGVLRGCHVNASSSIPGYDGRS